MDSEANKAALRKAVEKAGGQQALADLLSTPTKKVRQSRVSNWLNRDQLGASPEFCVAIEEATGVTRYELRPDVFGSAPIKKRAA